MVRRWNYADGNTWRRCPWGLRDNAQCGPGSLAGACPACATVCRQDTGWQRCRGEGAWAFRGRLGYGKSGARGVVALRKNNASWKILCEDLQGERKNVAEGVPRTS
jgi:hypothetical protein